MMPGMDINLIYFWGAMVMVLLPLTLFSWLTWLVVKAYRRERASEMRKAELEMRN